MTPARLQSTVHTIAGLIILAAPVILSYLITR